MITELPTGNLVATDGNRSIEFVFCHRTQRWVHPIRRAGRKPQLAKLPSTVERWAEQIFNCQAFDWGFSYD